jgi:hypothetical protein
MPGRHRWNPHRVQANWRETEDFRLGFDDWAFPRDDDPLREVSRRKRNPLRPDQ